MVKAPDTPKPLSAKQNAAAKSRVKSSKDLIYPPVFILFIVFFVIVLVAIPASFVVESLELIIGQSYIIESYVIYIHMSICPTIERIALDSI